VKRRAGALLVACLRQFSGQLVSGGWTVIVPLTVVSGDLRPPWYCGAGL